MSLTIWFTGLPASGKSTLAQGVAEHLALQGKPCRVLDGDELRRSLCADLGYSRADRQENIRRAAQVCRILNSVGVVAIAAFISPYVSDRESARRIIGNDSFLEIWLSTPLAACERRDPKGLYLKARAGEIVEFTGVDDPYEPSANPDLSLDTHQLTVMECIDRIKILLNRERP